MDFQQALETIPSDLLQQQLPKLRNFMEVLGFSIKAAIALSEPVIGRMGVLRRYSQHHWDEIRMPYIPQLLVTCILISTSSIFTIYRDKGQMLVIWSLISIVYTLFADDVFLLFASAEEDKNK